MKSYLPALTIALFFASCTTAYKSGQTPDDVYFSPARPAAEYVAAENNNTNSNYYSDEDYRDDRYLRMKVHNRSWNYLDDNWYSYNPGYYQYYNNYMYYNNPWFSYTYGNYYYNPLYTRVIVINSKAPVNNRPRTFNLNVYTPQQNTYSGNSHGYHVNVQQSTNNNNNYNNSGKNPGGFLRNVFSNSSSNSGSSNNTFNTNTSGASRNTTSGSSSSSSGSSSGHAPARRF